MKTKRLLMLALAAVCSVLVVVPPVASSPVSAAGILNLTKQAPSQVLVGDPITYTLGASNTGDAAFFNVSFRDVLAPGVLYTGPTTPSAAGEPQVITNTVVVSGVSVQQQTLIWSNVTDLQPRSSFSLSFPVDVNTVGAPARPDVHVVGAVIANTGEVYGSTDPRVVPTFSATGAPPSPLPTSVVRTQSSSVSTTLTAVEIVKGSDSAPEGELLRGVHDHKARYTLTVDVTKLGSSSQVVVTDTLPPQLEFLGCGGVDNSTVAGGQRHGYANAPLLSAGRTLTADPTCIAPSSVETQSDGSTLVTWSGLPTLSNPDQPYVISYLAGIPLFANAAFVSGTAPSPTSRGQASNLDNNTGDSTREPAGSEAAVTNRTRVDGRFDNAGLLEPGAPVNQFDTDELTRTIEDVRIRKETLAPVSGVFDIGQIARYRVTVETSEYMTASNVVLTDTIPNGMCPLVQSGFTGYPTIVPAADATGCAQPGAPTQPIQSVTARPAGGFDVLFRPIASLPVNGSVQVEYSAYMRSTYQGGAFNGQPTVSGDSFTNSVASVATTTGRPDLPPAVSGPLDGVTDGSSAALTTGSASIFKDLLPRDVTPRLNAAVPAGTRCPDSTTGTGADQYIPANSRPTPADVPKLGFRIGDQICFRLRVNFDTGVQTRNAIVSDFVPVGTKLVAGSIRDTSRNNVSSTVTSSSPEGPIEWRIGTPTGGVDVVDDQNRVFEVVFAVEVTTVAPTDTPVLTGNLMKMRTENSLGQAQSFRDVANFGIVPAPPVGVIKGVESIDVPPTGSNAANSNVDGSTVQQASQVRFRIDLTNLGEQRTFDAFSVRRVEVLDVLPVQVRCASIAAITNFGTVTNLGRCIDPGQTVDGFTNTSTTQSMIRWAFDESDAYALFPAGEPLPAPPNGAESGTRSLFYTMTIPSTTSVSTRFDNTAGVRTYGAFTNLQGQTSPNYIPANNIDPSLNSQANAEPARDTSWVITRSATVGKFVTSWIGETNNNFSTADPLPTIALPVLGKRAQAVIGEYVTYRYFVDIPAQTTVIGATLTDTLPANLVLEPSPPSPVSSPSLTFYPNAASATTGSVPAGVSFNPATGAVDFTGGQTPGEYRNITATDQRFEVLLTARVTGTDVLPDGQPSRQNIVRFGSLNATGAPLPAVSDSANVDIRQPAPTLDKVSDVAVGAVVTGGQLVTYTLTASTDAARPPLHDSFIEDCVPAGLESVTLVSPGPNDLVITGPAAVTAGCTSGQTYVRFALGTIQPDAINAVSRRYTAVVSLSSVGGAEYLNTAELTGSSLPTGNLVPGQDDPNERVYRDTSTAKITVAGAGVFAKTVTPGTARIGERVDYALQVTIPPNTNFFQSAVLDKLPLGLADVTLDSCEYSVGASPRVACGATNINLRTLPPSPAPDGKSVYYGLFFGDVTANPLERNVFITYSARVADVPANVAGLELTNVAQTNWDLINVDDSTVVDPLYPWTQQGDSATATFEIIEPDVVVSKAASDETPEPGEEFTYTLTVLNQGTSEAYNTQVVDTLPPGVEIVLESGLSPNRDGVYNAGGRTITWDTGSTVVPPGQSFLLTYRAKLAPSPLIGVGSNFTNSARVTNFESLPTGGRVDVGNTVTETVAPQFPRLVVDKTVVDAPPAYLDEPVRWQVLVTNTGGGSAFSVDVADVLPANWTYVAGSSTLGTPGTTIPDPGSTTAGNRVRLTWDNLGTLAPGASLVVRFQATPRIGVVSPPWNGSATPQVNDAAAQAIDRSLADRNLDGFYTGQDSASTTVDRVDLAITKASTGQAIAGSNFSWSIVVRNLGPDPAVGPFVVTDAIPTLPAGVTFASASGTGWSCTPATGPASPPTAGTVTCSRTGTLPATAPSNAFPAITFTVRIPSTTPDGTPISNTASVGGQRTYERPTDLANNTATDTDTIITRANLRIVKSLVDPPGLVAGTNATYNLAITNLGPSTSRATGAQPIVVRDTLPPTVSFVSATDIGGTPTFTCTHDGATTGGVVTCNRTTDMLLNAASNIRIVVSVPSGLTGNLTNTGTVTPAITTDPTPGNNTSTITNPIVERTDLGITKTALGPNVPGEPTTYRLSVTNNGPGDATVRIQDTLPPGLSYRSFSNVAGAWTCVASTAPDPVPGFRCDLAGKLTFTSPTLNVATVDVLVDTAPSVTGTVRNSAVVSTTAQDTNPANNTAFADLTFAGVADLAVTKTATATPVIPGGPISWTVNVKNLGPSDSQPTIRVDDQLPVGVIGPVTAVGVTGADDWTCTISVARFVSCTKATKLGVAAQTNIRIAAVVDPATPGPTSITNTATVFPTTAESKDPANSPNTANNTGTANVPVSEPAVTLTKAVSNATPQPGDQFTYTMTLTNAVGAAPAYNMKVSDVLPAGIVWVSGGTLTGNTVNWTVAGPLAGGASTTVSFVAKLAASSTIDTTAITNVAKLDSFESLPTGGRTYTGNADDADITPVFPRLTAAKSALGETPTYLNGEFAWEIRITNTGQGDAAKVDVTDLLPRNWTYVANSTTVTTPSGVTSPAPVPTVTDLNADAAIIDQQLVWANLGALKPGQSLTVALRAVPTTAVATNPGVGSTVAQTNRASAVTTDNTAATGNKTGDYKSNTATATARIDAADLEIRKLNAATPAIAGENFSWTLKVRNLGDDSAVGPFTVVDTLPVITPTPLTFVSATGTDWACGQAAGVVTCTRNGTLPAPTVADDPLSAFPDITVTVAIPSDYLSTGGMTNTATVAARTYDPAMANNTATAVTPVSGLADLQIAKRRTDATITAGSPITYQLDVSNNGPSTSRGTPANPITVIDTLPANTTFVSASTVANGDAWNCTNAVPTPGQVTCTLASDITTTAPAQTINITVRLASGAPLNVDVVNNAEVRPGATAEGAANPNDPTDPKIANNFASDAGRPIASADLVMDKRSVGTLVPGSVGVYRLRVDNAGPSDANAPTITDTLPLGLTFAGFTSNPAAVSGQAPGVWTSATTSVDLRSFSCTLDRALVTPGFSVVDIRVDIDSNLRGPIVNTSTVTSTTPDPIPGNNTDSDDTTFTTLADLAIVKTGPTAPVEAGTNFDWTLTVTNNGPSVSRQPIQVFDVLPDSVALVTDVTTIGAPWSCTSAPATVAGYSTNITCTLAGDLPSVAPDNVAPPIRFTVRALPSAGPATITNRSAVKGTTDEPADKLDNNVSNHDVVLIDLADVQIVKSPLTQDVRAGENATFALAVTNNGPSTADNVVVTDPLPTGMTVTLPFTATGWDCSASTTVLIDCERLALDPGAAPPITVIANVASSTLDGTKLINTATVATSSPGDLPGNNKSSADVIVGAEADLTITKTHPIAPDPVSAGSKLEFQMLVTNNGPSDTVDVKVTDTLPDGFSYLSVRGPWTCTPKLVNRQVIDCTKLGGGLAAKATADPLFILTQLDPSIDADTYTNVAEVSSSTTDPNTGNNKAEDEVDVETVADVSIVKSHDPDTVRIGENLVFTLEVSNAGPSEARDVVVTDTLPVGLTLVSAVGADDPSTWDCSATTAQSVSCRLIAALGPKTNAEDILVTALVEPAAFPATSNTAEVVTSTKDSNTANNKWTDDVVVPRLVDLFVTKTHAEPVAVGQPIVYTLTVGNNGPIDDDAVITVTDAIPLGLRVTDATSDDADCSIIDGLVSCTKNDGLAVDTTFTITVTADVLAGAYPSVTNTAEVSSPTDDKDPSNNRAVDTAIVPPLVDLAITKTHVDPVQVGGKITYTVTVRNNGPTPDPGPVRMLDTLPGSLTPVSATADGMACTITGQTVTCQALAPLGVNAELVITIVADVGPAAYPSVSNTAIVTTPGCSVGPAAAADTACPDTNLTNNQATDVADIAPLILLQLTKTLASQQGLNATWSFVVANVGLNATIQPIVLTDALPAGLVYVSAQGDGWACTNALNVVTCTNPGAVAAGATAPTLQIVTLVTAAGGSEIVNVATVSGGGPEVPSVTDTARVISPPGANLPSTGGGGGRTLLQTAPMLLFIGLVLMMMGRARRRPTWPAPS